MDGFNYEIFKCIALDFIKEINIDKYSLIDGVSKNIIFCFLEFHLKRGWVTGFMCLIRIAYNLA